MFPYYNRYEHNGSVDQQLTEAVDHFSLSVFDGRHKVISPFQIVVSPPTTSKPPTFLDNLIGKIQVGVVELFRWASIGLIDYCRCRMRGVAFRTALPFDGFSCLKMAVKHKEVDVNTWPKRCSIG